MKDTPNSVEELRHIVGLLDAWLTDHTENTFEEESEVDSARAMLLERLGDL